MDEIVENTKMQCILQQKKRHGRRALFRQQWPLQLPILGSTTCQLVSPFHWTHLHVSRHFHLSSFWNSSICENDDLISLITFQLANMWMVIKCTIRIKVYDECPSILAFWFKHQVTPQSPHLSMTNIFHTYHHPAIDHHDNRGNQKIGCYSIWNISPKPSYHKSKVCPIYQHARTSI